MKFFIFFVLFFMSCAGETPKNLGVKDGKFSPCPDKPNCVSSQSLEESAKVDPLKFLGTLEESKERLKKTLHSFENIKIITENENYIHAEATSKIFKFVDDVEFYLDQKNQVIHIKSASRIGHSDLGVNKGRVNSLHFEFVQL